MTLHALVVGVPAPGPFRYRDQLCTFPPIPGVLNDVDWMTAFLNDQHATYGGQDGACVLKKAEETGESAILKALAAGIGRLTDGDTFVLYLAGHGFQVDDPASPDGDGTDEVFAASDTGIIDRTFADVWGSIDVEANVVVIGDTCSADSLGTNIVRPAYEGAATPQLVFQEGPLPRRLDLAASHSMETALELPFGQGPRGVFTRALQRAWMDEDSRQSYRTWFDDASRRVTALYRQTPRLRSIGPDHTLVDRPPLR